MREAWPPIKNLADVEAFERIPLEERVAAWTVPDLLRHGASFHPDKAALLYLREAEVDETPIAVSYRDMVSRVNQAANYFAGLCPHEPPVVAVMAPSVPEHFTCLYAAPTAGTLCPLNWMADPSVNSRIVKDLGAKILVTLGPTPGYDVWESARRLLELAPSIEHVVQIEGPGGTTDPSMDFNRLIASQPDRLAFERRIARDEVAMYCGTGGTTGAPKIVKLTHGGIAYACFAYSWMLDHGPEDTMISAVPLFHAGGIVSRTMNPLARGVTNLVLTPMGFRNKRVLENFWALVERHGVTELNLVPTVVARLLGSSPPKSVLQKLKRHGTSGSAALLPGVARKFEELTGIRILSLYAVTECSTAVAIPPMYGQSPLGASGIRLPYTQVKIVTVDGTGASVGDCAVGETGTIAVKGPGVIPGYFDSASNAGLFLGDGWLNTGDRGRLDADGFLWVGDRAKDVIIRGGYNIEAKVIEEALLEHPAVALAAAVGKPDPYAGELPVAYVQLADGMTAAADTILSFARERILERIARPVEVHVTEAMPLTEVGKLAKGPLRRDAARRAFEQALLPVANKGIHVSVTVAESPEYGMVPTVTLGACSDRVETEAMIRDILDGYARRFVIEAGST